MDQDPKEKPGRTAQNVSLEADQFGQVHRDHRERLVNSITGFVRDRDKAEDITARAFEAAWEKREQFRGAAAPASWIQAIARNEVRSDARHDRLVQFNSLDEVDAREIPAPELITDRLENREDQIRLQSALQRLPMMYRRALTARYIDGLSNREIATREQIPPGTVGSRIQKGKQLLRDALERLGTSRGQLRESPDPPTWDR
jgi:RNA polymerase sigma-70 factor (ECF subfamily)